MAAVANCCTSFIVNVVLLLVICLKLLPKSVLNCVMGPVVGFRFLTIADDFDEEDDEEDDDDSSDDSGDDREKGMGEGGPEVTLKSKQQEPQGKHKTNLSNPLLKYRDRVTGKRCDKMNPNRYRLSTYGDLERHGGGFGSKNDDDAVREKNDPRVISAQTYLAQTNAGCGPSDQQNQDRVRRFENYSIANHPDDPYTQKLLTLQEICDMNEEDRPPKPKFPVRRASCFVLKA